MLKPSEKRVYRHIVLCGPFAGADIETFHPDDVRQLADLGLITIEGSRAYMIPLPKAALAVVRVTGLSAMRVEDEEISDAVLVLQMLAGISDENALFVQRQVDAAARGSDPRARVEQAAQKARDKRLADVMKVLESGNWGASWLSPMAVGYEIDGRSKLVAQLREVL